MPIVESIDGRKVEVKCIGCALTKKQIKDPHNLLFEGKHFEIRADYEAPIPGLIVIASKRHILGFAEFTKKEQEEFINLICSMRKAIKQSVREKYIELLSREDTIINPRNPSHFHIGIMPLYSWMQGKSIREILNYAITSMKTKENLSEVKKVSEKIKNILQRINP